MDKRLQYQRVLVIGGSSGIGLATARLALGEGAAVVIAANDTGALDAAVTAAGHPELESHVVDIMSYESILALFSDCGTFDHVVMTAAWSKVGSVRDLSFEDGYRSLESKLWGSYRVARAANLAPRGSLTFISGSVGLRNPDPHAVLQGAINAAIETLVRGLALEFAPARVNAVSPGLVDTPLYAHMASGEREALMQKARDTLPLRRVAQPEEIADVILLCMSNPHITGITITIDGGAELL